MSAWASLNWPPLRATRPSPSTPNLSGTTGAASRCSSSSFSASPACCCWSTTAPAPPPTSRSIGNAFSRVLFRSRPLPIFLVLLGRHLAVPLHRSVLHRRAAAGLLPPRRRRLRVGPSDHLCDELRLAHPLGARLDRK